MKQIILFASFLIFSNGFSADFSIVNGPFADVSTYITDNPVLADVSVYISDSPFADVSVYINEGSCIYSGKSINISTTPFTDVSIYISRNPALADVSVYINDNPALADHSLCVPSSSTQRDIEKYVAAFMGAIYN